MKIRLGIPLVGGQLPRAAREIGAPVLVSANALAVYKKNHNQREFVRFRSSPDLDNLDCALDSAGFVAWAHYGEFPWTVENYVSLAASRPWAWWAQMDACCEKEIASSRDAVRMRQAETVRLLTECRLVAKYMGASPPMPVLQGDRPSDYVWCLDQMNIEGENLIGVGSMCRRNVNGINGLLAVVDALDRVLPNSVRLHLFGVKSNGVSALSSHDRIGSIDSMAWDVDARCSGRKGDGATMSVRISAMNRWYSMQKLRIMKAKPVNGMLDIFDKEQDGISTSANEWAEIGRAHV